MPTLTGAEIVIRLLERQGVGVVAGIPGGAALPLYDALASSSIRHVLARHEQGAGFIAQGMARATGRPQVCLASSGPGATNLVTAIADARLDSVPLVAITAQVPQVMIGTDAFQEVDMLSLGMPITKARWQARSAAELLAIIPEAFRVAASGRPGPVLVDLPKDVQLATTEVAAWPEPGRPDPAPAPDPAAIATAARAIAEARRPILYLGGGVIHAEAAHLATALAERADLPTVMTLMGLGALPADHPLSLGMLGMHAARYTNLALEECDLLVAVGARFDDRATGRLDRFCPDARVVHIDIDAREIGKLRRPDIAIRADAGLALAALLEAIAPAARPAWRARVAALRRTFPLAMPGLDDLRQPYGIIRAVAALAASDTIVTTDVGQHQMWAAQAFPVRRPRRWLTSGGLGTMGFGLPAAIGAALACPDRPVVCITGDGSLMMNLPELATAAEAGVDVKIVLMDNRGLGLVNQQQALFYGGRSFAACFERRLDFSAVARGFGVGYYDLGDRNDPAAALAEAFAQPGPWLIRAPIEPDAMVLPMVPPGAANRDMIDCRSTA